MVIYKKIAVTGNAISNITRRGGLPSENIAEPPKRMIIVATNQKIIPKVKYKSVFEFGIKLII